MRYMIPFREPEETIDYLRSLADENGTRLVVYADDGEKFGTWPNTYKHCYEDGWLDRFFTALDKNSDWINIMHFGDALEQLRPAGRVYLPTASYREMMEWAMPTAAIHRYEQFESTLRQSQLFEPYKDFVHGGFWRNFLIKYPEINNMHKKMLLVSKRLNHLKTNKNGAKLRKAKDHLWASQCNCPYWYGVFGGAYLNHLRYAIYHEMLQAEKSADDLEHSAPAHKKGWVEFSELDFDLDGSLEILVSTKSLNAYFAPNIGGTLFELDFKPKAINLMDSMSRREEAYHYKLANIKKQQQHSGDGIASIHDMVIAKEEGLEKKLFYDWYRRSSLVDHFLEPGTTLEQFASANFHEKGNFINQPYKAMMEPFPSRSGKSSRKGAPPRIDKRIGSGAGNRTSQLQRLTLWRRAPVWVGDRLATVEVRKTISFEPAKSRLQIDYSVCNLSSQAVNLWFGMEFLFALLAGNTDDRFYTFSGKKPERPQLGSVGIVENARQVGLTEGWLNVKINLHIDKAATIWRFPIETISQSEAGFERVYQSSIVFPNWQLQLDENESWQNHLTLQVS
jgi:alpha-amylase